MVAVAVAVVVVVVACFCEVLFLMNGRDASSKSSDKTNWGSGSKKNNNDTKANDKTMKRDIIKS